MVCQKRCPHSHLIRVSTPSVKAKGKMSMGEKELRLGEERVSTFFKLAFRVAKMQFNTVNTRSAGIGQHSVKRLKCGQPCLDHLHDCA